MTKPMTKEDALKRIAELEEYIKANGVKNTTGRFIPEEGEEYFYACECGSIDDTNFYKSYESDIDRVSYGNAFKTEELAEQHVENRRLKVELIDLAHELNNGVEIDWSDETDQSKYYIELDTSTNRLRSEDWCNCKSFGNVYCLDSDFADKAIVKFGENDIKKLFEDELV